ncbi:MAG: glutathione peroxidase [Steroidobacteraceae bacterium]
MAMSLLDIPLQRLDGSNASLREYAGSVMLIVNVASACGLTPQYEGLESIFEQYRDRGFVVLGFPCNDFAAQEPGTHEQIQAFCETRYGVEFPLFGKVTINSGTRHPLYKALIEAQPKAQAKPGSDFRAKLEGYGIKPAAETDVLWNFEKFLIDRSGSVVARFMPDVEPKDPLLGRAIEEQLTKLS